MPLLWNSSKKFHKNDRETPPLNHVLLSKSSWLGLKFEHWFHFSSLIVTFLKFFKTFILQNTSDQLFCKYPVKDYPFKVNNGNTKMMCEINSKVTMKTPEQRRWTCFGVLIVNFEQTSLILLGFPLLSKAKLKSHKPEISSLRFLIKKLIHRLF